MKQLFLLFFWSFVVCVVAPSVVIGGYMLNNKIQNDKKIETQTAQSTVTVAPTPSPITTPVVNGTGTPIKQAGFVYDGTCRKIDEKTTRCNNAPDSRMSTPEELFQAVNQYRIIHNLNPVQKDDTLCYIAQSRANEMQKVGQLDEHEGLKKYFDEQEVIQNIGEVMYGSSDGPGQPILGVHIVEWGWDRSVTGHKEALQDSKWQYGCAGIAGYIAVFEFGVK